MLNFDRKGFRAVDRMQYDVRRFDGEALGPIRDVRRGRRHVEAVMHEELIDRLSFHHFVSLRSKFVRNDARR